MDNLDSAPLYGLRDCQLSCKDLRSIWESQKRIAVLLEKHGEYDAALEMCRKPFETIQAGCQAQPACHTMREYLDLLNRIARLLRCQTRWHMAHRVYQRCLRVALATLGSDHLDTAQIRRRIADVLHAQGHLGEALQEYLAAVPVFEKTLGHKHLETADIQERIANVLHEKGEHTQAARLYVKVLDTKTQRLGHDHPDTCSAQKAVNELVSLCHNATYAPQTTHNVPQCASNFCMPLIVQPVNDEECGGLTAQVQLLLPSFDAVFCVEYSK